MVRSNQFLMGCYGIGVSRLMGTIVEACHDDNGIIWPKNVAPFQVHILQLRGGEEKAAKLEKELEAMGIEVLLDDTNDSPGKKFANADMIGIPLRIVVSSRGLENGEVEVKQRDQTEPQMIPVDDIQEFVKVFVGI